MTQAACQLPAVLAGLGLTTLVARVNQRRAVTLRIYAPCLGACARAHAEQRPVAKNAALHTGGISTIRASCRPSAGARELTQGHEGPASSAATARRTSGVADPTQNLRTTIAACFMPRKENVESALPIPAGPGAGPREPQSSKQMSGYDPFPACMPRAGMQYLCVSPSQWHEAGNKARTSGFSSVYRNVGEASTCLIDTPLAGCNRQ